MSNAEHNVLKIMTYGAYDLQMIRMQMGLRLCANFRNKLKDQVQEVDEDEEAETVENQGELSEKALKVIDQLRDSYRRLTDGVARNRTIPAEKGFTGDALISSYTELVLVDQYMKIEANERSQFRQLEITLEKLLIYSDYLKSVRGIGPAMAAVLITYFDPAKAHHITNFWSYAGLDVAPDGRGRSRRAEHLIDREYTKKDGTIAVRKSVTYNPWLKSRLLGALAASFLRTKDCPWREQYDNYKNRVLTDPAREKCTLVAYKRAYRANPDEAVKLWPPLRVHRASVRYMIKMFLIEFWTMWREFENLPLTPTYHEAKLGHRHGGDEQRPAAI